jgi:predicted enzyme related to lactoylglutathione lyase
MTGPVSVHVVVYAGDLEQLGKFYESALGLTVTETDRRYVVLQGHGYELSVVAMPSDLAAAIQLQSPPTPLEETPIKVSFLVPAIEQCRRVIAAAGGYLKPVEAMWEWRGQLHLDGVDPEGNVFQLRQVKE